MHECVRACDRVGLEIRRLGPCPGHLHRIALRIGLDPKGHLRRPVVERNAADATGRPRRRRSRESHDLAAEFFAVAVGGDHVLRGRLGAGRDLDHRVHRPAHPVQAKRRRPRMPRLDGELDVDLDGALNGGRRLAGFAEGAPGEAQHGRNAAAGNQ